MQRREFLLGMSGVGASLLVPGTNRSEASTKSVGAFEVPTVEGQSAIVTWKSRDSQPFIVTVSDQNGTVKTFEEKKGQFDHLVHLTGLQPKTTYSIALDAGDGRLIERTGFTTLKTISEKPLIRFALINDLHVGEKKAGQLGFKGISVTKGYSSWDPDNPHWLFSLKRALTEISEQNVDLLIVNGDISSTDRKEEYLLFRTMLENLKLPILCGRGNHDIPHRRVDGKDNFLTYLGVNSSFVSAVVKNVHFVLPDFIDPRSLSGRARLTEDNFRWFRSALASQDELPTFVINHHPILSRRTVIDWADGKHPEVVRNEIAGRANIMAVFCGHTHGAQRTTISGQKRKIVHVTTPATKEYPGGYSIVSVYSWGFRQVFYRLSDPDNIRWINLTRGMYYGFAPRLLYGELNDRCYTFPLK